MARGTDALAAVTARGLTKMHVGRRGPVMALRDVSFTVRHAEFYALLGPSGCGKTTLLRCLAGLERPEEGSIALYGRTVFRSGTSTFVRPQDRNIGMVFQSYAIWPHMTVHDTVAFPLRVRHSLRRKEIDARVAATLAGVKLGEKEHRMATELSGGEQQRLALARALVAEPKLLLLDEPLSNLDAKLREEMRGELRELQGELDITTVYVTHDQAEAMSMADRIAVMFDGEIVQTGLPSEVYRHPANATVARFIGRANLLPVKVTDVTASQIGVETASGPLIALHSTGKFRVGDSAKLMIRPEDVRLHTHDDPSAQRFPAQVERTTFLGSSAEVAVRLSGRVKLVATLHPGELRGANERVWVELAPAACTVVEDESSDAHAASGSVDPAVVPADTDMLFLA